MNELNLASINESLMTLKNALFECEYRYHQYVEQIDEQYIEFRKKIRDLKIEESLRELNKSRRNILDKLQDEYLKSRRKIEHDIEKLEFLRKENN